MTDEASTFLARYGDRRFDHSGSLIPLLREGRAKCRVRSDSNLPCSHYKGIYDTRAKMLEGKRGDEIDDMRREFERLTNRLGDSPEEPCCLWIFETSTAMFSVFEMVTSQKIAGCFLRDNTLSRTEPK